ncbi:hypothetical protein BGX38DRAFT_1280684 [Terfezia claveryi]|nr:hypothetical protein BGX38DRAFT_1280684 [Terfezia claveryi]
MNNGVCELGEQRGDRAYSVNKGVIAVYRDEVDLQTRGLDHCDYHDTITPTTITTTTTTTRTTITTRTTTTTTTSITPERGASASQTIDLDAVVQRSIDCQVLAEMKAERVLQYCIDQAKYQPAAYQLDSQLPPFLRRDKVRWNNQWIDSHLELITETDSPLKRWKSFDLPFGVVATEEVESEVNMVAIEGVIGRLILELLEKVEIVARKRLM